jgi:branched-chain amino acid transport system substrate-binding protein
MKFPGIEDFFKRYTERAIAAKVDPLGYYLPPFNYAIGQMIEQSVNATKTIDNKKLAEHMRKTEFSTIVGPIGFDKNGERAKPRLVSNSV